MRVEQLLNSDANVDLSRIELFIAYDRLERTDVCSIGLSMSQCNIL